MDIKKFIQKAGWVSFRDFMEHALYCPEDGFYGAGKVKIGGKDMDFTTHPELCSPHFARGIIRQINHMWKLMGESSKFDIVETGAGNGVLARDILMEAKKLFPEFYQAISLTIIEISPVLIKKQKKFIPAKYQNQGKVSWWRGSALDYSHEISGVVISNELFDSLPFHRIVYQDGRLFEIGVKYEAGKFKEELMPVSAKEIIEYIANLGMKILNNQHLCVSLDSVRLVRHLAKNLKQGYIITIDYGEEAEKLYGSDLSYVKVGRAGQVGTFPYRDISGADITSHVDFTSLIKEGRKLGLADLLFLKEDEFFKYWLKNDLKKEIGVENAFQHFIGSGFKVLIQGKDVPALELKKT